MTQASMTKEASRNNPCLFPTLSPVFYKANMTNAGSLRSTVGDEEYDKSGFTFKKRHQSMMNGSYTSLYDTMDPNNSQFKTINNMKSQINTKFNGSILSKES